MKAFPYVAATLVTLALSSAALAADAGPPTTQQAAEKLATATCAACHGAAGRSTLSPFPNLAAQTAPYLEAQLKAFRDQKRADPDAQAYMWGLASPLNDTMIRALAAYYAAQHPARGQPGNSKLLATGKQIFDKGMPAEGIPPCNVCHGANGEGNAMFPRIAGQHAPYLVKQILLIQNALRVAPVMHGLIKDMNRDEMLAVTTYLASLGGQP
jgi:cytochrome c553